MLDDTVYKKRIEKVRNVMEQQQADFVFLTPSPAFQYLTGIQYEMQERLIAMILTKEGEPQIISPAFEVSGLSQRTWIDSFLPWAEDENPYSLVVDTIGGKKEGQSALFDESLSLGVYWSLEKAVGKLKKTLTLTPSLEKMRLIKSDDEISLMKKAGKIIDRAVTKAYQEIQLGITELETRHVVSSEVAKHGAEPTFAIVQFGNKSAHPHGGPDETELKKGDLVLMDCGCSIDGYNTDMTRVGVAGEPTDEQEEVHAVVVRAQEAALSKLQSGLTCGAADGIARREIQEEGYGEYFTHRLGHGIGLQVHEPPYVVRGSSLELASGMCHSVEPGIYMESKFGVRIEDLVCIRDDGVELLTYSTKGIFNIDA
ncbi:MAG: M24 family metallopeptidase [Candidatus Thorarchaeota archaeon]|jgi:Xaa-Pro aminopeptidase